MSSDVEREPSGPGDPSSTRRARVVDRALSLDACVERVRHPGAGAVVVMIGCVRDHTHKDGARVAVTRLEYSAYVEMAETVIDGIVAAVEAEHAARAGVAGGVGGGVRGFVEHRTGSLAVGDAAVVVAVASPHRKDAFVACEQIIDRLKHDAPIWKREHGSDGVTWVGLGP